MRVLVSGINGFVGQHLAHELHRGGTELFGVGQQSEAAESIRPLLSGYAICDLTDSESVAKLPLESMDAIVNLAGLAAIGLSFEKPITYMDVNVGVLSVLMKHIKRLNREDLRIVAISSGAVYAAQQRMPLKETSTTDSTSSPYAASKLAMEKVGLDSYADGLNIVIARPFNHTGPGQGVGFIVPDLAQQLLRIETGESNKILVGNLDAKRDYTDVRDIVRAYRLLLEKGVSGEIYNVCSGTARSGHDILGYLQEASGIDAKVEQDPNKLRPSDNPVIYGEHHKLTDDTGWQPSISIEQTISAVIPYWRSRKQ